MRDELINALEKIKAHDIYIDGNYIEFDFNGLSFSIFIHDHQDKLTNTSLTTFEVLEVIGYEFGVEDFYSGYEWEDNLSVIIDFIEELDVEEVFEPYENLKNYIKDQTELHKKYTWLVNVPLVFENVTEQLFKGNYKK